MNVSGTNIEGLFVIEINPFDDKRGRLFKPFTNGKLLINGG